MLFGAVSGSMAVSLGRSSGATLLGRPLDVTVQLELDSADAGAPYCVEAEVFYADDRIAASRVQASLERSTSAQDARIRIRVARPVDEPVVTLYVRAGCVQRSEKRYVLLADVATEQVARAVRHGDDAHETEDECETTRDEEVHRREGQPIQRDEQKLIHAT